MHYASSFNELLNNFLDDYDALMRVVIIEMYKRTGYRIGHIHDCFTLHPNFVRELYDVLRDIYTNGILDNMTDKLFFEPMKEGLVEDIKEQIAEIQKSLTLPKKK